MKNTLLSVLTMELYDYLILKFNFHQLKGLVIIIYVDGLLIIQKLGLFNAILMLCQAFFMAVFFC